MAMATSMKMAGLLSITLMMGMANAQANAVNAQFAGFVVPTNATLPTSESMSESVLTLVGRPPLADGKSYNVAPLTENMGRGQSTTMLSTIQIQGTFKIADYQSTGNLTTADIALINCDPDGSNIDPSTVVGAACAIKPRAIVLYSLASRSCNLTQNYNYTSIFTITNQADSASVSNNAASNPTSTNIISATIAPSNATNGNGNQNPAGTSNEGGPAPTTAVAMSILYSITGIITLLFLIIIFTGALRAHRHPERYGPRTGVTGRPRQSRAKGIARAMLEALPIVKFGDPEPVKPGARDIELEDGRSTSNSARPVTEHVEGEAPVASGLNPATADSVHSGKDSTAANEAELGCSICTEDFKAGEDVRVLPCDHKYHPACIDPWLLNVSGTCPLCRHDLRPILSHTSEHPSDTGATATDTAVPEGELPPPLEPEEGNTTSTRRRSRFLDLNRLRHAPAEERIAALRRLREQSQRDGESTSGAGAGAGEGSGNGVVAAEERSRRARITGRFRDVFRINTRPERVAEAPVLQTRTATTAPAFSAYGVTRSI